MLDLAQVLPDIHCLAAVVAERRVVGAARREIGLKQARMSDAEWQSAEVRRQGISDPWLAADCAGNAPGAVIPLPDTSRPVYTSLATDGSQVPLDRHAIAPCFLINVGSIVLHYGTGERSRLCSTATLHYSDSDIYEVGSTGEQTPLSEKVIANRRLIAESQSLAELIREHADRYAIALVDDPLILWTPPGEQEVKQREVVGKFCRMLEAGRVEQIPVAGYISRPGGKDVVGALRLTLCSENCDHQIDKPCAALNGLTDAELFGAILAQAGERSLVFRSRAKVLNFYPPKQAISFFYLHVGSEIARIEVPQWVADDPNLLHRVHVLCCDQARKGNGYPVALGEAHEQAVVRGPEREAFMQLVENALVQVHVPALATRKALAKRTRIL